MRDDTNKSVEKNPITGNPLPELETVPKPIALMETVTLISLAVAVASLVLSPGSQEASPTPGCAT